MPAPAEGEMLVRWEVETGGESRTIYETSPTFVMPDADVRVRAVCSPKAALALSTNYNQTFAEEIVTAESGLAGKKYTIPAGTTAGKSTTIYGISPLVSVETGSLTARFDFVNAGENALSFELAAESFGATFTTGGLTLDPGDSLSKYVVIPGGFKDPYTTLTVTGDVAGETALEVYGEAAPTYPDGDPDFAIESPVVLASADWGKAGLTGEAFVNNATNDAVMCLNNATSAAAGYVYNKIANMPAVDGVDFTRVYFRAVNYSGNPAELRFDFRGRSGDDKAGSLGGRTLALEGGQAAVFFVDVDRIPDDEIYLYIAPKVTVGVKQNVTVRMSYSPLAGIEAEEGVLEMRVSRNGAPVEGDKITANITDWETKLDVRVLTYGDVSGAYAFSVGDPTVAEIAADGAVTFLKPGVTFITIESVADPSVFRIIELTILDNSEIKSVTVACADPALADDLLTFWANTGTIELTVTVDATGILTDAYTSSSSDETVATIEQNVITVLKYGFTTITVTAADDASKSYSFLLAAVDPANPQYPITVTGGTPDKPLAAAGDTVTLTVGEAPAGMRFVRWAVTPDTIAVTDNRFTMPDRPVTVEAVFEYVPYSVSVTGGKATVDGKTVTTATYGQTVTLVPDVPYGMLCVGWINDADQTALYRDTFAMPAENVAVTAKLSINKGDIKLKKTGFYCNYTIYLEGSETPITGEHYDNENWRVTNPSDKLDGLQVVRSVMNASMKAGSNIGVINDKVIVGTNHQTVRFRMRNTGSYDIAVYIRFAQSDKHTDSEIFRIPAGETRIFYQDIAPELSGAWAKIFLAEDIGGKAGETVTLDIAGEFGETIPLMASLDGAAVVGTASKNLSAGTAKLDVFTRPDAALTYTSSNTAVAAVAADGAITLLKGGNTDITITGTAGGITATNKFSLTVVDDSVVESITVLYNGQPIEGNIMETETLGELPFEVTVSATGTKPTTFTGSSSDENVATVAGSVVTTVGYGAASITFTADGDESVSYTFVLTVTNPGSTGYAVIVTGGTADKTLAEPGETVTLTPGDAPTGQRFAGWEATPDTVVITDNTFTMPSSAVSVTAVYEYISYALTVTDGAASVGGQTVTTAVYGQKVTLTPAVKEGKMCVGWTVAGGGTLDSDSLVMPASDTAVTAVYSDAPHGNIGYAGKSPYYTMRLPAGTSWSAASDTLDGVSGSVNTISANMPACLDETYEASAANPKAQMQLTGPNVKNQTGAQIVRFKIHSPADNAYPIALYVSLYEPGQKLKTPVRSQIMRVNPGETAYYYFTVPAEFAELANGAWPFIRLAEDVGGASGETVRFVIGGEFADAPAAPVNVASILSAPADAYIDQKNRY